MSVIYNRKAMIFLGVSVIAVMLLFVIYSTYDFSVKGDPKRIDIIVYGDNSDRWENLRRGAMLAAKDYDAEINLITMSSLGDYNEQISLIEREVSNGVDGIMLAACNSEEIGKFLHKARIRIPVVMVETGVGSKRNNKCISADDFAMGYELGEAITERENPIIKAAIISDSSERISVVNRERGLREVIEPYANHVVTWERSENELYISAKAFLQRKLTTEAVDVIVALDNETADAIMAALDNLNMTRKVYAISTSDQSVYYLDQKKIKALQYQTEFGIGYVGAYRILDKSASRKLVKEGIKYKVIDKVNMYDYDNQTLLFPFAK